MLNFVLIILGELKGEMCWWKRGWSFLFVFGYIDFIFNWSRFERVRICIIDDYFLLVYVSRVLWWIVVFLFFVLLNRLLVLFVSKREKSVFLWFVNICVCDIVFFSIGWFVYFLDLISNFVVIRICNCVEREMLFVK